MSIAIHLAAFSHEYGPRKIEKLIKSIYIDFVFRENQYYLMLGMEIFLTPVVGVKSPNYEN